jgi:hypothetical protein
MSGRAAGEEIRGLRGEYVIERLRGSGGFGLTYVAVARATGEKVIVKELRFERLRDWKSLELFEREGRVLAELRHPCIPAYRDFFAHDGVRAMPVSEMSGDPGAGRPSMLLVQQFIDGPTLEERTRSGARLGAHEVEPLLRSLLETLAYLHELTPPVVHRDINPKNIVLGPQGRPHLVDFGAIQDRLRFESETGSTTVGTLGYMPLEQMRGGARAASDLYALGVTLLVAVSGRPPNELPVDEDSGKLRVSEVAAGLPCGGHANARRDGRTHRGKARRFGARRPLGAGGARAAGGTRARDAAGRRGGAHATRVGDGGGRLRDDRRRRRGSRDVAPRRCTPGPAHRTVLPDDRILPAVLPALGVSPARSAADRYPARSAAAGGGAHLEGIRAPEQQPPALAGSRRFTAREARRRSTTWWLAAAIVSSTTRPCRSRG